MGKPKQDPIQYLKEWNNHLYNPGYWVNRYTPFNYPKRSRLAWLLMLAQFLVVAITMIILWVLYFITKEKIALFLGIVMGFFTLLGWRYVQITRPVQESNGEEEVAAQTILEHQQRHPKKKNLPKRRKDYK